MREVLGADYTRCGTRHSCFEYPFFPLTTSKTDPTKDGSKKTLRRK